MASAERRAFLWQRIGVVPSLALAAGLLAMGGMSASAAFSSAMVRRAPEIAAWALSGAGPAKASLAASLVVEATVEAGSIAEAQLPDEVGRLASEALLAEPMSVQAARALALYHQSKGDDMRARSLMRQAAKLSRRDAVVNLWLVEDYLREGDTEQAASLIDATLRTGTSASGGLLPRLAGLAAASDGQEFLMRLLQNDPPWSHDFWSAALQEPAEPTATARLRMGLHARGAVMAAGHDARLIAQLVEAREFALAFSLHGAAKRAAGRGAQFAPVDWRLVNAGDFGISTGDGGALRLDALAGAQGVVAQRLVPLGPGRYTLAARSSAPAGQLSLRLACAELQGEASFALTLPLAGDGVHSFSQQTPCRYAWLSLVLTPGEADRSFSIGPILLSGFGGEA